MVKLLGFVLLSLLILSACSMQQTKLALIEALEGQSIQVTVFQVANEQEFELNGAKSLLYKLDNGESLRFYHFASTKERIAAERLFEQRIQFLSSHAPIIYRTADSLIFYSNNVDSPTRTAQITETTYGAQIQKAISNM